MSSITGGGATINGDSITGGGSIQDLSVSNLTITNKGLIQREINEFKDAKELVSKEYVDANSGGGGNPFDQSLNTTDMVEFLSVNTGVLQSTANLTIGSAGSLAILTSGINISSNVITTGSTITTTKPLTLDNQLTTKLQVETLIDNIVPTLVNITPLEQKTQNQTATSGITNFDGAVNTTRTLFVGDQELVTKKYVDDSIPAGSPYELIFAVTDQITNITTTGQKFQIRAPRDFTISKFKLSLNSTAGVNFSVTLFKNGVSFSSVFLPSLVQDTSITESFLENDIISVNISNVGLGTASGLIVYLLE